MCGFYNVCVCVWFVMCVRVCVCVGSVMCVCVVLVNKVKGFTEGR